METYVFSSVFELGSLLVAPIHVRIEKLRLIIAAHAHSNTSYEIHYTERGRGSVTAGGRSYAVEQDTLYVTGPGVVHEQVSDPDDPVIEYCLYLNCRRTRPEEPDYFRLFTDTAFWMGQDEGRVFPLFVQLIEENRHPRPGTKEMSETLLKQIIIKLTRMYSQQLPPETLSSSGPVMTQAGMMPVAEAFGVQETVAACDEYFRATGRRMSYEYSLIEGVNDSESCAQELAALLHGKNAHVNLIPVNPIREREYRAPDRAAALRFQKRLENLGINVTIRKKMGADIDSACGQLRLRAKAEQGE